MLASSPKQQRLSASNLSRLGSSSRKLHQDEEASEDGRTSQSGSVLGGLVKGISFFGGSSKRHETSSQAGTELGKQKSGWGLGFSFKTTIQEEEEDDEWSSVPSVENLRSLEEKRRAVELSRLRTLRRRGQMHEFWEERARNFDKLPLPERAVQNQAVLDELAEEEELQRKKEEQGPMDPFAIKPETMQAQESSKSFNSKSRRYVFDLETNIGRRLHDFWLAGHSHSEIRELHIALSVQEDVKKKEAEARTLETVSGAKKRPIPKPAFYPPSDTKNKF